MNNIRCILFDRDGTLGELVDKRFPQTLKPYCNVKEVFDVIKAKGYLVGIITNQSSIARGTGADYDFEAEFSAYGADVWKICPHDTADNCNCRKPKNGLLLAAAQQLDISPEQCLVVGDRYSDVQCAKSAKAQAALVLTGFGKTEKETVCKQYPDTYILERFDDVFKLL